MKRNITATMDTQTDIVITRVANGFLIQKPHISPDTLVPMKVADQVGMLLVHVENWANEHLRREAKWAAEIAALTTNADPAS